MFLAHELEQVVVEITRLFLVVKYDHIDTLTPRLRCCCSKTNGGRGRVQTLAEYGGLAFLNEASECLYLWMFLELGEKCAELHEQRSNLLV